MPDIYLQVIDQVVEDPSPEEGEITIVCRAWHAPGLYVSMNAYVNFADSPNQMSSKVRQRVVDMCALESVTVSTSDRVIMGGAFAQL